MARLCAGFGEFFGCDNAAGPKNPYWCDRCDELRMAHLDKQFAKLAEQIGIKNPIPVKNPWFEAAPEEKIAE